MKIQLRPIQSLVTVVLKGQKLSIVVLEQASRVQNQMISDLGE